MSRTVEKLTVPEDQDAEQVVSQLKALNLLRKEKAERRRVKVGRIQVAVLWILGVIGVCLIIPSISRLELPITTRIGVISVMTFVVASLYFTLQLQSDLLKELIKLGKRIDEIKPPEDSD